MSVTPFQSRSALFDPHYPYDQSGGVYDSDASHPFSYGSQQTHQPYLYSQHTPPDRRAAREQSQAGVQDSESGEEAQERDQARTGDCCTRAGPCCLPALAAKAFNLAQGVGKNYDVRMKCACGNEFQFSNKD